MKILLISLKFWLCNHTNGWRWGFYDDGNMIFFGKALVEILSKWRIDEVSKPLFQWWCRHIEIDASISPISSMMMITMIPRKYHPKLQEYNHCSHRIKSIHVPLWPRNGNNQFLRKRLISIRKWTLPFPHPPFRIVQYQPPIKSFVRYHQRHHHHHHRHHHNHP